MTDAAKSMRTKLRNAMGQLAYAITRGTPIAITLVVTTKPNGPDAPGTCETTTVGQSLTAGIAKKHREYAIQHLMTEGCDALTQETT